MDGERRYRLAHFYALAGRGAEALHNLRKAIAGGFFNYPYISRDPLLANIRDTEEFKRLLRQAKKRLVMEKSPHVLMVADGAEMFAREQGVELVARDYFYTDRQWKSLLERRKQNVPFGGKAPPASSRNPPEEDDLELRSLFYGTVGAVALDKAGNLAAGTSTGGRVNKKPGRVGDSPIIGAGTYANNEACAVSTTGLGEYHMRLLTAREIAVLVTYRGLSLQEAADEVVKRRLVKLGGGGGAIAIDGKGNIAMPFTDNGMYRGYIKSDGKPVIRIYQD